MLFSSSPSGSHRVVVTGIGVITAFGQGWDANVAGFREGLRAFRPVSLFDVSRHRARLAAEADLPAVMPAGRLNPNEVRRLDRASKLLLIAAAEAFGQSKWEPAENVPIVLGTTSGGMSLGEAYYRQAIARPHSHRGQPTRVIHYQAQRQALDIADAFGMSGPVTMIANACASGANAVGHAFHLVRSGRVRRAITGGYDALSQLVFSGFDSLQALSTTECRPFDAHRDGLGLGEGAAVFTLETLEGAKSRSAEILGEIVGYGASTDSHHLTQPHPAGDAALASMRLACADARIRPAQINYINAHGTGTPLNDSAEALAVNRWAEGSVKEMRVSSTKASIGHLLGAAGAVEVAICLMALRHGFLPPTRTIEQVDAACEFSIVRQPEEVKINYALTNSFGFGGANATVVLKRWS